MNKLILSKKDYYPRNLKIMLMLGEVGGYIDARQFALVLQILNDAYNGPKHIRLIYPEKYYPNNVSTYFWDSKVNQMMKKGYTFEVMTSDVYAASHTSWDESYTYQYDEETDEWVTYELGLTTGRTHCDVATENPF